MNFRKQVMSRSSLLVFLSLGMMMLGRYGFAGSVGRHTLMSAGAWTLTAATIVLFLDMRKRSRVCAEAR